MDDERERAKPGVLGWVLLSQNQAATYTRPVAMATYRSSASGIPARLESAIAFNPASAPATRVAHPRRVLAQRSVFACTASMPVLPSQRHDTHRQCTRW